MRVVPESLSYFASPRSFLFRQDHRAARPWRERTTPDYGVTRQPRFLPVDTIA